MAILVITKSLPSHYQRVLGDFTRFGAPQFHRNLCGASLAGHFVAGAAISYGSKWGNTRRLIVYG